MNKQHQTIYFVFGNGDKYKVLDAHGRDSITVVVQQRFTK